MAAERVRVMIVDDHPIVRSGLRGLIETQDDLALVDSVGTGEAAVAVVTAQDVDVILMDLKLDGMSGIAATRAVLAVSPDTAVVMLTTSSDQSDIVEAFEAGARGYILKDATPDELVEAIHAAARGESPMTWRTARALVDARNGVVQGRADAAPGTDIPPLTARELDVLTALRDGLTNKMIARRLGISEATVKAHLTSVFQRLGVRDRTQAALWMQRNLP